MAMRLRLGAGRKVLPAVLAPRLHLGTMCLEEPAPEGLQHASHTSQVLGGGVDSDGVRLRVNRPPRQREPSMDQSDNHHSEIVRLKATFGDRLTHSEVTLLQNLQKLFSSVLQAKKGFGIVVETVAAKLSPAADADQSAANNPANVDIQSLINMIAEGAQLPSDRVISPMTEREREFSENAIGAIDFVIRNSIGFGLIANVLGHDLAEILHHGSLDAIPGFCPKVSGWAHYHEERAKKGPAVEQRDHAKWLVQLDLAEPRPELPSSVSALFPQVRIVASCPKCQRQLQVDEVIGSGTPSDGHSTSCGLCPECKTLLDRRPMLWHAPMLRALAIILNGKANLVHVASVAEHLATQVRGDTPVKPSVSKVELDPDTGRPLSFILDYGTDDYGQRELRHIEVHAS